MPRIAQINTDNEDEDEKMRRCEDEKI